MDLSFGQVASTSDMSLHGVTVTDRGAVAVGFSRTRGNGDLGRRRAASIVNRTGEWDRVFAGSPGEEDGLTAIASRGDGKPWAVGFTTIEGRVMPLAMRFNGFYAYIDGKGDLFSSFAFGNELQNFALSGRQGFSGGCILKQVSKVIIANDGGNLRAKVGFTC